MTSVENMGTLKYAVEYVLLNKDILFEIQSYTNINSLLNSSNLQSKNKILLFDWKLTSIATWRYYEDEEFQKKLLSIVCYPKKQIQLNEYVYIKDISY
jgi:hypothetical protein